MKKCKKYILIILWAVFTCLAQANANLSKDNHSVADVRLYALDCGTINIHEQFEFSDT